MLIVLCVARKLRPCLSYSRRRDHINSVPLRSLDKGGGVISRQRSSKFQKSLGNLRQVSCNLHANFKNLRGIISNVSITTRLGNLLETFLNQRASLATGRQHPASSGQSPSIL